MATLLRDPRVQAVGGAACIAMSAMFMKASHTSTGTAAIYRCVLALPVLIPLALRERRRLGERTRRQLLTDFFAGVLLGIDLVLWGASIPAVGAGIATVLVNVQVVVVPLLALLLLRERLSPLFAVLAPLMLGGLALASGAVDTHPAGAHPISGGILAVTAGTTYAGYLFLLRLGGGQGYRSYPVCVATIGAAVTSAIVGSLWGGIDLTPGWQAAGYLAALAMTGQVCGWLLLGAALPRMRANVGATLLLLQPVLAVLLGFVLFAELPGTWQWAGCVLVVAIVWMTSVRGQKR